MAEKTESSDDCQKTRSGDGADMTWHGTMVVHFRQGETAPATEKVPSPTVDNRLLKFAAWLSG